MNQLLRRVASSTPRALSIAITLIVSVPCTHAGVKPFPASFRAQQMPVPGGTQYVRVGGQGPAVVLLHGFGDTGDMWEPLAAILVKDHQVIVPDLRGMGLSSHPENGYEKAAQARDLAAMLDELKVQRFQLVTHDIGNMVGYALAAQYRDRVTSWAVMDAPLPGLGNWAAQLTNPKVWHFNFRGPDVERLVAGRERILLDRFYNELSANPAGIDEATRAHYAALYAKPGAIHNALGGQFEAFVRDAEDNQALLARGGKLQMPVLAIGGDHSYGPAMQTELQFVAEHVEGAVIANSGHWIMEENSQQATALIAAWIARQAEVANTSLQMRMTQAEIASLPVVTAGPGTSGLSAVTTTGLFGDPAKAGLYGIELNVAPNTVIEAHTHRDTRTAVVVSGTWYFGYGPKNEPNALKPLAAGSFYTEPAGQAHFGRTRAEGVVVIITGFGPSDTIYAQKQ